VATAAMKKKTILALMIVNISINLIDLRLNKKKWKI